MEILTLKLMYVDGKVTFCFDVKKKDYTKHSYFLDTFKVRAK